MNKKILRVYIKDAIKNRLRYLGLKRSKIEIEKLTVKGLEVAHIYPPYEIAFNLITK